MILWFLACHSAPPESVTEPGADATARMNLVVVQADTLRADHLSLYGYDRETMPYLSSLEWQQVNGVRATTSWTPPSAASMLSGLDIPHHGVRFQAHEVFVDPLTAPTFVSVLQENGYSTGLFTGNGFLSEKTGMAVGFEHQENDGERDGESNLDELVSRSIDWLDRNSEPFVLFFQPMDPHDPYSPMPEDLGTWDSGNLSFSLENGYDQADEIRSLMLAAETEEERATLTRDVTAVYDEQLLGMDRSFQRLMEELERRELLERTVVVVDADHGETLNDGDSRQFSHGETLRPELLAVPLLLRGPGIRPGILDCPSSIADIAPTLLEILGVGELPGIDGQSLRRACRDHTRAVLYKEDGLSWISVATATQQLNYQCQDHSTLAWDFSVDPSGQRNVSPTSLSQYPFLAEQLQQWMEELNAAYPEMPCSWP